MTTNNALFGATTSLPLPANYPTQIRFLSMLISIRALARGIKQSRTSQIVKTATQALRRDCTELSRQI